MARPSPLVQHAAFEAHRRFARGPAAGPVTVSLTEDKSLIEGVLRLHSENVRGDVVWAPPAEKHWHGATATTAMTHIAITDGVEWLEKVTDEQYGGKH